MRSASRLVSLLGLLATAACYGETGQGSKAPGPETPSSPTASAESSAPTLIFHAPEPRSVLEVPPAEMRLALANTYRVRPDRRFLGAVAEAHHLASGRALDTVTATFRDGAWTIEYGGERVGTLPELPGFADGHTLLAGWAARLLAKHPLDSSAALAAEDLGRARELLDRVRPVEIASGLKLIDAGWSQARRREWLASAADGLTLLAIQVPKNEVGGDPIVARALAATTLAQAAGDSVARAMVLLADYMGYTAEAASIAARLPVGDAARGYAQRDTATLQAMPGSLARFLYLAAMSRGGSEAELGAWMRKVLAEHSHDHHGAEEVFDSTVVTSGVFGRGLDFLEFDADRDITPEVPRRLHAALMALIGRQPRDAEWGDVLQNPYHGDRKLAQFEDELSTVAASFRGPFLDAALTQSYFRAQLHQAFERRCIYLVDGPPRTEEAVEFARAIGSPRPVLWAETARWCSQHTRELTEEATTTVSLAVMREIGSLSSIALRQTLDDVEERFTFKGVLELEAARAVFPRLDSRPGDLLLARRAAWRVLNDIPLGERYDGRLVALAPREHQWLAAWYAFHIGDIPGLDPMATDTLLTRDMRVEALVYMLERGADTNKVHARFAQLIAEPGCPWCIRNDYIRRVLEPAGRFEDAARVAREWLASQTPGSMDYVYATTALARQYQSMGMVREAWDALAPIRKSRQLGAVQRSSLIALDLGQTAVAESLARANVDNYSDSPHTRVTLAQILWAKGEDSAAARAIVDPEEPLESDAWADPIAPAFVRSFGKRPTPDAVHAFAALAAAGADTLSLGRIPSAASRAGKHELAAALAEEWSKYRDPRVSYPKVYRYIKTARGDSAATAWITARWAPPGNVYQAGDAYRFGEFDLLWTVTTEPDPPGNDGSFIWLMRALGELQEPKPHPERRRALLAHYRGRTGAGAYDLAGRYLLGLEPEEKLVALATSPKRRVEYSYYIAIKALSEGRYRDASDWLRVTVETRQMRDGEFLWAKEMLEEWQGTGKTLPEAAKELAR